MSGINETAAGSHRTTEAASGRALGRATRKDVARLAGVSTATVSYALNGVPGRVSPATLEKVRAAAKALDYRPNAAARALNLGRTDTVGLLVPEISNPFFASLCEETEAVADERGQAIVISNARGETGEIGRRLTALARRDIDGVVIASCLTPSEAHTAANHGVPTVLLNQFFEVEGVDTIGVDLERGARTGTEHLVGHGHARIGFVGSTVSWDRREAGWLAALTDAGLTPGPVVRTAFTPRAGFDAGMRMASMDRAPTAVFVSSDVQAIGFLQALRVSGMRLPDDLAVVSFDGTWESEFSWPPLTTLRQPLRTMVAEAFDRLADTDSAPSSRIFDAELVIRESCGCRPAQSP